MSISKFLFSSTLPANLTRADKLFIVLFVAIFILAILAIIYRRFFAIDPVSKKLAGRVFNGFLVTAILGGIWIGMRYLQIPILGIRFVASLIFLGFAIWLFFILKYVILKFIKERSDWQKTQLKNKYLRG